MPFKGILGGTAKLLDGYEIPLIGLGTYSIWNQADVDSAVDAALMAGYRLFDTANFYNNEKELGNAFKKLLPKHKLKRENIFIITKANIRSPNVEDNAKKMVQHSLDSLQCSYIDLQLIHYPKDWGTSDNNPENSSHRMRIYRIFEEYKDSGLIRSIGVSNFEARHINELFDSVKYRPVVNQCEFHPHLTRPELVEYCRNKGILFQAHTPLAAHSKSLFTDTVIISIANKYDTEVSQIILAFAHHQKIGIIPKSSNVLRIKSNISFLDICSKLTEEDISSLIKLNKNKRYSDCDGWNVK